MPVTIKRSVRLQKLLSKPVLSKRLKNVNGQLVKFMQGTHKENTGGPYTFILTRGFGLPKQNKLTRSYDPLGRAWKQRKARTGLGDGATHHNQHLGPLFNDAVLEPDIKVTAKKIKISVKSGRSSSYAKFVQKNRPFYETDAADEEAMRVFYLKNLIQLMISTKG